MALNFGLLDTSLPEKIAGSYYAGQQQRQQNELAAQQAAMRQQELGMRQQEFGMRQQEVAQLAQERQAKLQRSAENQKLLTNLSGLMEQNGDKLNRPTLSAMLRTGMQTNQSELVQIATKGLQALDEQEQFEAEMARVAPAPAAPAAANALAPAAQPATAAPTNALAGGYSRPQIESMLTSPNARMREMGGKLLGALPKETADPADLVMMRQLGYPLTQAGYQAYRDAQRQERLLSPAEEAQKVRIAAAMRPPAAPRPEQPPVAVVDPVTGKQVYVTREEALRGRMTPATAMESLPPKEIQKREAALPQATSAVQGFESKADKFIADLKALRDDPGLENITGPIFGRTGSVSREGSRAQARYDKVVAKGGFQALQDLRDASKTGGALGNVSNQEGKQLTASFAAIDQRQNAADVRAAIDQAIADIEGSKTRMREAYDATYSYKSGGVPAQGPATVPGRTGAPAVSNQPGSKLTAAEQAELEQLRQRFGKK